ncbi:MAG: transcriptional regulator [Planctomycetota bacterium]
MAKANKSRSKKPMAHQSALEDIDRLFHEKARLGILTTLVAAPEGLGFNELKAMCELTDGNLNRHLKVLVESNVLSVKKTGQGRTTHSHYRLTKKGQRAFTKYLDALEQVLLAAKLATEKAPADPQKSSGLGFTS